MILEDVIVILLCISILGYLVAAIAFLRLRRRLGLYIGMIGWSSNLGIFGVYWYMNGYPPFASMYQVLTVLSLVFLLIFLFLYWWDKGNIWLLSYFCFGSAIPLVGALFMDKQVYWSLVPALQSVWFVPHVFSYMLAYALCIVGFVISLLRLNKKADHKKIDNAIYDILRMAFPFMIIGMFLGAIWAEQVWGDYWSWDIKEIWSLITIMLYSCYFHARRVKSMGKYKMVLATLAFLALLMTFIGLNYIPDASSLHLYS